MNYVVAILDNVVIRISIGIVSSVNRVGIKWLSVRFCPDLAKSGDNKIFTWRFFNFYQTVLHPHLMKRIDLHKWIYYFVFNWWNHYYFFLIKQIYSRYLIHNTLAMGHIYKIKELLVTLFWVKVYALKRGIVALRCGYTIAYDKMYELHMRISEKQHTVHLYMPYVVSIYFWQYIKLKYVSCA